MKLHSFFSLINRERYAQLCVKIGCVLFHDANKRQYFAVARCAQLPKLISHEIPHGKKVLRKQILSCNKHLLRNVVKAN